MTLRVGDCLDVFRCLRGLASIFTDPPGGGSFMGLAFDASRGGRDRWIPYYAERFRVARTGTVPGSWGLFWSFPRTAHWTACALDDAGWEVVSCIEHVHGQGWPKGRSQLKPAKEIWWLVRWGPVTPLQIDRCRVRRSWAERSEAWFRSGHSAKPGAAKIAAPPGQGINIDAGGSWPPDLVLTHCPACREVGARKVKASAVPSEYSQRTQVKAWTNGAHRHDHRESTRLYNSADGTETVPAWECLAACACGLASLCPAGGAPSPCPGCGEERWWACPVAEMDGQSGTLTSGLLKAGTKRAGLGYGGANGGAVASDMGNDSGGASRFFPCFHYDAKASRAERQAGCDGLLWVRDRTAPIGWRRTTAEEHTAAPAKDRAEGNVHATIKPVGAGTDDGFTRWGVRLVTPVGGRVGDPFVGSGSTAVASQIEGHGFDGCDIDPGAVDIARARLAFWTPDMHRHVLREAEALKAATRASKKAPPTLDDLPLFASKR